LFFVAFCLGFEFHCPVFGSPRICIHIKNHRGPHAFVAFAGCGGESSSLIGTYYAGGHGKANS
jgi:hypothetical protein